MNDKGIEDGRKENRNGAATKALRPSLFEPNSVAQMQGEYKISEPYRHLVIPHLMDSKVLKTACEELKSNMQATLKETDIFKVGPSEWLVLLLSCPLFWWKRPSHVERQDKGDWWKSAIQTFWLRPRPTSSGIEPMGDCVTPQ